MLVCFFSIFSQALLLLVWPAVNIIGEYQMTHLLRLVFLVVTLLPFTSVNSYGVHENHPYDFLITKHAYKLSEIYQIKSHFKDTYPGSVKKSAFRIRTNYDLSNIDGWQGTGITRLISLGTIYPWAIDIDIYDTRGVQIGLIDGDLATLESAKFNIVDYDESGKATQVGIAYATPDFNRFVILESRNNPHPIAELNRNYSDNTWSVSVHYPEKIDDRTIRIFASFVSDYQDKFLKTVRELELDLN